jgi:hypothetical protein
MRKQVIRVQQSAPAWEQWLDANKAASVVSSEEENHPIEPALLGNGGEAGVQLGPGLRRYGSFSTARRGSKAFGRPLKRTRLSAGRSSF